MEYRQPLYILWLYYMHNTDRMESVLGIPSLNPWSVWSMLFPLSNTLQPPIPWKQRVSYVRMVYFLSSVNKNIHILQPSILRSFMFLTECSGCLLILLWNWKDLKLLLFICETSVLLLLGVSPGALYYVTPENWTLNIKLLVLKWNSVSGGDCSVSMRLKCKIHV